MLGQPRQDSVGAVPAGLTGLHTAPGQLPPGYASSARTS